MKLEQIDLARSRSRLGIEQVGLPSAGIPLLEARAYLTRAMERFLGKRLRTKEVLDYGVVVGSVNADRLFGWDYFVEERKEAPVGTRLRRHGNPSSINPQNLPLQESQQILRRYGRVLWR